MSNVGVVSLLTEIVWFYKVKQNKIIEWYVLVEYKPY